MSGVPTPGPWQIDPANGDIVSGPLNLSILYATTDADKRFMAAAPDLLEALQWAVDHFDGNTRCNAEQESNYIEICRAAIARAKDHPNG